jgi:hypothetical protein
MGCSSIGKPARRPSNVVGIRQEQQLGFGKIDLALEIKMKV